MFLSSNINDVINASDYLVLAVPSAFIKKTLEGTSLKIKEKVVFSAIKGIVPEERSESEIHEIKSLKKIARCMESSVNPDTAELNKSLEHFINY